MVNSSSAENVTRRRRCVFVFVEGENPLHWIGWRFVSENITKTNCSLFSLDFNSRNIFSLEFHSVPIEGYLNERSQTSFRAFYWRQVYKQKTPLGAKLSADIICFKKPQASLSENCNLWGTDTCIFLKSNGGYCAYYPSDVFATRGIFGEYHSEISQF